MVNIFGLGFRVARFGVKGLRASGFFGLGF